MSERKIIVSNESSSDCCQAQLQLVLVVGRAQQRESSGFNGILVPAGTVTIYDQVLGENAKRPFLHVRYRVSPTEDRKYKSWVVGSAGGAMTSDKDNMEVHFLSERALCTMGVNNFLLMQ